MRLFIFSLAVWHQGHFLQKCLTQVGRKEEGTVLICSWLLRPWTTPGTIWEVGYKREKYKRDVKPDPQGFNFFIWDQKGQGRYYGETDECQCECKNKYKLIIWSSRDEAWFFPNAFVFHVGSLLMMGEYAMILSQQVMIFGWSKSEMLFWWR